MPKFTATPVLRQAPVHEVSDANELLRQVDHYYPNLKGWLKKLRDTFAAGGVIEKPDPLDGSTNCPCCGVELTIEE